MKLTAAELAFVRGMGLYVTEKCDGCGKLLNQIFRYTIARKSEGLFCRVPGPGVLRRPPGSQEEINAREVCLLRGNAGREKPRIAAISLGYKQPKPRPRTGTKKPVRLWLGVTLTCTGTRDRAGQAEAPAI